MNRHISIAHFIFAVTLLWIAYAASPLKVTPLSTKPVPAHLPALQKPDDALQKLWALAPEYGFSLEGLLRSRDLVLQAVKESKASEGYSIIIDKGAYRLFLMKDGTVQGEYPIELSRDPINDKKKEGDACTPEGFYQILYPQEGAQTRFYKALTIDYPNRSDLLDFNALKRSGALDEDDTIGGGIQIHGRGSGKPGNDGGLNWTLGCIALGNPDMDKIFPLIKQRGTPVLIVKYGAEYALKR